MSYMERLAKNLIFAVLIASAVFVAGLSSASDGRTNFRNYHELDSATTTETNSIYISDWAATHAAEKVTVNGVEHTVFKLKATDTSLIRGGLNEDVPGTDQIGNTRNASQPSVGAIEYASASQNDSDSGNGNNDAGNNTDKQTDTNTGNGGNDSPTGTDNTPNNNQETTETPDGNSTPEENASPEDNSSSSSSGGSSGGGCNSGFGIFGLLISMAAFKFHAPVFSQKRNA